MVGFEKNFKTMCPLMTLRPRSKLQSDLEMWKIGLFANVLALIHTRIVKLISKLAFLRPSKICLS